MQAILRASVPCQNYVNETAIRIGLKFNFFEMHLADLLTDRTQFDYSPKKQKNPPLDRIQEQVALSIYAQEEYFYFNRFTL